MFTEAPSYLIFWAGWTVWGSNSGGGEIFHSHPEQSSGAHPSRCTVGTGFLSMGLSSWGVALTTSPHPVKESVELFLCSLSGP